VAIYVSPFTNTLFRSTLNHVIYPSYAKKGAIVYEVYCLGAESISQSNSSGIRLPSFTAKRLKSFFSRRQYDSMGPYIRLASIICTAVLGQAEWALTILPTTHR
jgi:hypothetical protein